MAPLRVKISDDLKNELQSYADAYGISLAAAVRIMLRTGLDSGKESTS